MLANGAAEQDFSFSRPEPIGSARPESLGISMDTMAEPGMVECRMPRSTWLRPAAALLGLALSASGRAGEFRLISGPHDADRVAQVVSFPFPAEGPTPAELRDAEGRTVPLEIDGDGTARFIIPGQMAGETLIYLLGKGGARPASPNEGVSVATASGDLRFDVDARPALGYRVERDLVPRADIQQTVWRAGYVHPVFSPMGKRVSEDYPSNHVHHHGIWSSWTKTGFQGRSPDFWNMHLGTGRGDLLAVDRTWSGLVSGGLEARLTMTDLGASDPVVALNETWRLTLYAVRGTTQPLRMFDVVITQSCATGDPVNLPTHHYGGLGVRGSGEWEGKGDAARFLTSEGITDRVKANETRARWCHIGGLVEGGLAGMTVLGHPENFRAPQPVRVHPTMPFFSFAPQQLGEFAINPGRPYVARFRVIVTDGEPDRAWLDACWNAYTQAAEIRIDAL